MKTVVTRPITLAVAIALLLAGITSPAKAAGEHAPPFTLCHAWGHTLPKTVGQQYASFWVSVSCPHQAALTHVIDVESPGHPYTRFMVAMSGRAVENGFLYDYSFTTEVSWQLSRVWTIYPHLNVWQTSRASAGNR